jgi:hypothetical protein
MTTAAATMNPTTAPISSGFGTWPKWRQDAGLGWHHANDYPAPMFTPIIATHDGVVESTGAFATTDGGHSPTIDHGSFGILHAHQEASIQSSLGLRVGDPVKAGDTIGLIGNKGWSTGPHSHCIVSLIKHSYGYWNYGRDSGGTVEPHIFLTGGYDKPAILDRLFTTPIPPGLTFTATKRFVTQAELSLIGHTIESIGITVGGKWVMYVPGAPAIVNKDFPKVLAEGYIVSVKRKA